MTTDQDRLNRLADALADDILIMTDEEILAEAKEDGIDVHEVRRRFERHVSKVMEGLA